MATPTEWYRGNYLISTNPSLIQPAAINDAFGGGTLYWTKAMDEKVLSKMLKNSLCFGVYELPTSSADIAGTVKLFACSKSLFINSQVAVVLDK
jgi:hypothetical protein